MARTRGMLRRRPTASPPSVRSEQKICCEKSKMVMPRGRVLADVSLPLAGAETLGMWLRPAPEQLKVMEARGEMRAPTL